MFKNFSSGLFTSTSLPTVIALYRLNGDILLSFCYHKMTKTWTPAPRHPLFTLVRFWYPPAYSHHFPLFICKRSKLYINPSLTPYKNCKLCDFSVS